PQPEPEREQAPGERPGGSAAHCSSVRVAIESLVILSARASAIALALASHDARASVPKTLRNYALALNRDAGDAILGAPCRSASICSARHVSRWTVRRCASTRARQPRCSRICPSWAEPMVAIYWSSYSGRTLTPTGGGRLCAERSRHCAADWASAG